MKGSNEIINVLNRKIVKIILSTNIDKKINNLFFVLMLSISKMLN